LSACQCFHYGQRAGNGSYNYVTELMGQTTKVLLESPSWETSVTQTLHDLMPIALGGSEFAQAPRQVPKLECPLTRHLDQCAGERVPSAFAGIKCGASKARRIVDQCRR
jgi:hypothetical protein